MKMCRAGTEKKKNRVVKESGKERAYICVWETESEIGGEKKKRKEEGSEETWWVM